MAISPEARARWRAWRDAGGEAAEPLVGGVASAEDVVDLGRYFLVLGPYQADGRWRQFVVIRRDAAKWGRRSLGIGSWSAEAGARGKSALPIFAADPDLKAMIEAWFLSRAKPGERK